MRVLIGVTSCEKFAERRKSQLETWIIEAWLGRFLPDIEIRFFLGAQGAVPNPDPYCQYMRCGDGYEDQTRKTERLIFFAFNNGFDFLFKCDDDTYVRVDRLVSSGFEKHDYVGWTRDREYAQGGAGYWLSKRAMQVVASIGLNHWNEDAAVGKTLALEKIFPVHDDRYQTGLGEGENLAPTRSNSIITLHNCRPEPPMPQSSRPGVQHSASFRRSMYQVHADFWRVT